MLAGVGNVSWQLGSHRAEFYFSIGHGRGQTPDASLYEPVRRGGERMRIPHGIHGGCNEEELGVASAHGLILACRYPQPYPLPLFTLSYAHVACQYPSPALSYAHCLLESAPPVFAHPRRARKRPARSRAPLEVRRWK